MQAVMHKGLQHNSLASVIVSISPCRAEGSPDCIHCGPFLYLIQVLGAGYEGLLPKLVAILDRMKKREVQPDYTYYGIASPWLQVKCLRVLQYFPITDDPALLTILLDILRKIITGDAPLPVGSTLTSCSCALVWDVRVHDGTIMQMAITLGSSCPGQIDDLQPSVACECLQQVLLASRGNGNVVHHSLGLDRQLLLALTQDPSAEGLHLRLKREHSLAGAVVAVYNNTGMPLRVEIVGGSSICAGACSVKL